MTRLSPSAARLTRRQVVARIATTSLAPGLLAAQTPAVSPVVAGTALSGTSLHILQGVHPVAGYDTWFEQMAYDWGATNGVQVSFTRRIPDEIPGVLAAEIAAGSGHDLVDFSRPLPQFEAGLHDLSAVVTEASAVFGAPLDACRAQTFNPVTGRHFGLCHGYSPFPGTFRQSMWSAGGLERGPATWDDLLTTGSMIWNTQGVPIGLSLSPEPEANATVLSLIWAFGGAIQDASGHITINSSETVAAVTHLQALFQQCMLPEVLEWRSDSNDRWFTNNRLSYTPNPLSVYRALQPARAEVADDLAFSVPLAGPAGLERALSPAITAATAMVPVHAAFPETAAAFLLHLIASYDQAVQASLLAVFPAFPEVVPSLTSDGGLLDADPFGSSPPTKLSVLKGAAGWTAHPGWPGPTNAMIEECMDTSLLANMAASVARDEMSPEAAVADAETRLLEIAETWRARGLMT